MFVMDNIVLVLLTKKMIARPHSFYFSKVFYAIAIDFKILTSKLRGKPLVYESI